VSSAVVARRTIPVQIQGQEYRVRGDGDPGAVRRAASLVDETMARVRERTHTVDSLDAALLAALNLANRLLALSDDAAALGAAGPDPRRLAELIESIEFELAAGSGR
jgi:cell division protein ZapA (FtsZ GTPase activity inhibitor)